MPLGLKVVENALDFGARKVETARKIGQLNGAILRVRRNPKHLMLFAHLALPIRAAFELGDGAMQPGGRAKFGATLQVKRPVNIALRLRDPNPTQRILLLALDPHFRSEEHTSELPSRPHLV